MIKIKDRTIINPIFLFLIGSVIGLLPKLAGENVFDKYNSFSKIKSSVILIYVCGLIFFSLGVFFSRYIVKKRKKIFNFNKVKRKLLVLVLLILVTLVLINIKNYGGIPLLKIIKGRNISFVNQVQRQQSNGIYGLKVLITYMAIILFLPLNLLRILKIKRMSLLFKSSLTILIFSISYTGKRQFIFIFITIICTYNYIFFLNNYPQKLKKIKKVIIKIIIIGLIFFTGVGQIRGGNNVLNLKEAINPIVSYASLPYMNLTSIASKQNFNPYKNTVKAFKDTIFQGFPYKFRGENQSIDIIPKIEKTSPNTLYGEIFWNFGYLGVFFFTMFLGLINGYIFRRAMNNEEKYITIYSLSVWPLISIHTYNHFLNLMYWIYPIIIVNLLEIYKRVYKNRS